MSEQPEETPEDEAPAVVVQAQAAAAAAAAPEQPGADTGNPES